MQNSACIDVTPCLDDTDTLLFYFDDSDHGGLQTPLPERDDIEHEFSLDHFFEPKRQASRGSSPVESGHSAPSSYTAQTMLLQDGSLSYDSARSPWPSPDELSHNLEGKMSSSAIAIRGRQQQSSYELSSSELDWHTASLVPLSCSNGQAESSSCPSECVGDYVLPRVGPYGSWSSSRDSRSAKWPSVARAGGKGRRKRRHQVCADLEQQLAKLELDLSELSRASSVDNSRPASRSSSPLPIFPSSLPSSFLEMACGTVVDHMRTDG